MIKRKDLMGDKLKYSSALLFNEVYGRKRFGRYRLEIKKIRKLERESKKVGEINAIKIEVRNTEKPHNLPHFHVTAPGKIDAVYTIDPVAFFKGKIDGKNNKAVLKWAEENRDKLVYMWNDLHGYRIRVS